MHVRIAVDRDVLYIAQSESCLLETIGDRLAGKTCPMLDSPKPLLFGGCNQLPFTKNARRGIAVIGVQAQNNRHNSSFVPATAELRCLALADIVYGVEPEGKAVAHSVQIRERYNSIQRGAVAAVE